MDVSFKQTSLLKRKSLTSQKYLNACNIFYRNLLILHPSAHNYKYKSLDHVAYHSYIVTLFGWVVPCPWLKRCQRKWGADVELLKTARLLHSPGLMLVGLSVGMRRLQIGWHQSFMIDWSKYRWGLHRVSVQIGIAGPIGISAGLQTPLTVLCAALTDVQGDC